MTGWLRMVDDFWMVVDVWTVDEARMAMVWIVEDGLDDGGWSRMD